MAFLFEQNHKLAVNRSSMIQLVSDAMINLRSGFRLAFFRPCNLAFFRFGFDQLAVLLICSLLLEMAFDFALALPNPEFNPYALPIYTFGLSCFFAAAYIIAKLFGGNWAILQIGVIAYSFVPVLILYGGLLSYFQVPYPDETLWLTYLFASFVFAAFGRMLYLVSGRLKGMTAIALVLMAAALIVPQILYGEYRDFWVAKDNSDVAGEADFYAKYRALDAEALMYRQPEMLNGALAKLLPQRPLTTDIYFVGFAGFATEDVFSIEVDYIKNLLDRRFDTKGRSLNLVNHLTTLAGTPLATSTNLAFTLKRIGQLMDQEEDMLLLYLTSHGSTNELSVSFWPLALNNMTPDKLRGMLDEAGIKWRMIVISSCYSGSFIKALQGPNTLVATASAEDKSSFGCGAESEFTYFGEAVFKDQLNRQRSFIGALQQAMVAIGQREIREKREPSSPQLSIGTAIKAKLKGLDTALQHRYCNDAEKQNWHC